MGRRLSEAPEHHGKPKALLHFAGTSLLARHLAALRQAGVAAITVVAGYAGRCAAGRPWPASPDVRA